jgi:uncharacterized tellurite resistance protein B-like protein
MGGFLIDVLPRDKPALAKLNTGSDLRFMQLPSLLEENFRKLCGIAPKLVVRALHDLDGGTGGTWIAVGEDTLVFYHRASGGEFNRVRFRMNEIVECTPLNDGSFACLRLRFANANFTVRCSLFDQTRLESVARACLSVAAENPIEAPARLTPSSAFCAGIHAILDADGHVDPLETDWLCRTLPDPVAIEQGSAWFRVHGLDSLLRTLPSVLDTAQRECLLVNQLSAIMSDGLLESEEIELIERFLDALEISRERYAMFFDAILTRNQLAVLLEGDGSEALDLFTACLVALTRCDAEKSAAESDHLSRLLADADTDGIRRAEKTLEDIGVDDLITGLPGLLNQVQSRTLLANLLAVGMVDGELAVSEQEFIERVRQALGIESGFVESLVSVLLIKNSLGVLTR